MSKSGVNEAFPLPQSKVGLLRYCLKYGFFSHQVGLTGFFYLFAVFIIDSLRDTSTDLKEVLLAYLFFSVIWGGVAIYKYRHHVSKEESGEQNSGTL